MFQSCDILISCSFILVPFCNWLTMILFSTAWGVKIGGAVGHTTTRIGWSNSNFKSKNMFVCIRRPYLFSLLYFVTHSCHVIQVMQFLEAQEYNMFSRIVFDTAPTVIAMYRFASRVDSRYLITQYHLLFAFLVDRDIHFGYYHCQTSWMHPLGRSWRYC
jgi:hypothetical protein